MHSYTDFVTFCNFSFWLLLLHPSVSTYLSSVLCMIALGKWIRLYEDWQQDFKS